MDFNSVLADLIERIYDTAITPTDWETVIGALAAHFNSQGGGFFVHSSDPAARLYQMTGVIDAAQMSFYDQNIAAQNPWYQVPGWMGPGKILTDVSLERHFKAPDAFTGTRFYQDWARPLGMRHTIGGTLLDEEGSHLNFTLFREADAGPYDPHEVEEFRLLSRHLAKAVQLGRKIDLQRCAREWSESALDQLDVAVFIVNSDGRILHTNHRADTLIRTSPASGLETRGPFLTASDHSNHEVLAGLLKKLDRGGGYSVHALPNTTLTLFLTARVYSGFHLLPACRLITVFAIDMQSSPMSSAERLRTLWSLSNKEAGFATLLLQGLGVKEIGVQLGLTVETSRWYCKEVMRKVGVKRQSQLVSRLLRGMMVLPAGERAP
jgi:DNA-binding CsgD family transcriptional regulator